MSFSHITDREKDVLKTVALNYGNIKSTEAPWYGFYDLMLSDFVGIVHQDNMKMALIIFPQHPVAIIKDNNVVDDDEDEDDEDDAPTTPDRQHAQLESPDPIALVTPERSASQSQATIIASTAVETLSNHISPCKEVESEDELDTLEKNEYKEVIQVVQRVLPLEEQASLTPQIKEQAPMPPLKNQHAKKERSECIPDFLRRRFYLDSNNATLASRIDLIVELKKKAPTVLDVLRARVWTLSRQVEIQAEYAFKQDDKLSVVGYIIGIGNAWNYGELDRDETLAKRRDRDDDEYRQTASSQTGSSVDSASNNTGEISMHQHLGKVHLAPAPADDPSPTSRKTVSMSPALGPSSSTSIAKVPGPIISHDSDSERNRRVQDLVQSTYPYIFTDIMSPVQKQWFKDINYRLEKLDDIHRHRYLKD
ncbi:hypothetical protein BDN70DRAFT_919598 [Pholiota conissans]|uniref:Uncharacterized protein n=1 Tax=Pholiota conissans TaxID=109636 RepID=A0A9P6CWE9_9AGAR|nr:hypothetical protein BDN70DRAFT_919598 [Pholiota conissans]